jgi:hypothetical protein
LCLPSSPSNARLAREHNVLSPQVNLCTQSYLSITPCDTTISRPDTVDTVTVGILNSNGAPHNEWVTCEGDLSVIEDCLPGDTSMTFPQRARLHPRFKFIANRRGTGSLTITAGDPPGPVVTTVITVNIP